ncbi:MAG: hypothetical protein JSS89_03965 [Bacteroidetes bacterium]|nr:hypothetical protein [Bacteroidota bacterium]
MTFDAHASARALMVQCLTEAVERSGLSMTIDEPSTLDGTFIRLRHADASIHTLFEVVAPHHHAYDDVLREKARSVATRMQAPRFAVCDLRQCVVYRTEAVVKRLYDEEQIEAAFPLCSVFSVAEAQTPQHRQRIVDVLRAYLTQAPPPPLTADELLALRLEWTTSDLIACTHGTTEQRTSVVRLVTSVLAYDLLQFRHEETLDRLTLPYGLRSPRLLLDIVGAFLRDARDKGHRMFPSRVSDVHVLHARDEFFRASLADLVAFLQRMDLVRIPTVGMHRAIDRYLTWSSSIKEHPTPILDVVDLALRMTSRTGPVRFLELGTTTGLAALRMLHHADALGLDEPTVRVYAPTADDARMVQLRTTGRLDERSPVTFIEQHERVDRPWTTVSISGYDVTERHRLRLLLERLPLVDDGMVILYLPSTALHEQRYAGVRNAIMARFDIEWILVSDVQPLSEPDVALCVIVARMRGGEEHTSSAPAKLVYVRAPFANFFLPCESPRERDAKRLASIDAFLRYLSASERGKNNNEAVVHVVAQTTLRTLADTPHGTWSDLLIPADVLSRILLKAEGKLRPLRDVATVASGLRTGAHEFFVPDVEQIAHEGIEPEYWQRTLMSGATVDNTVIVAADEFDSIATTPSTSHRLLLVHGSQREMQGTNMFTRIQAAERDGLHTRATLRGRDRWYDLGDVRVPDIIFPRRHDGRWLAHRNTSHAFITDSCVGVHLHDTSHADAVALWMNSTVGLFFAELFRRTHTDIDITVTELSLFPVPSQQILRDTQPRQHREFQSRPMTPLTDELGTTVAECARPDLVRKDRRRLDAYYMDSVLALSPEEQRWMYRCVMMWWTEPTSNLRHLTAAIIYDLEVRHKLRPLSSWYTQEIEQLPTDATRTIIVPDHTQAEVTSTMFSHAVRLLRGSRTEEIIDCSSKAEAEIIAVLCSLGKATIEIPKDEIIIDMLLPQLHQFQRSLESALDAACTVLPDEEIRELVKRSVRARMTAL